MGIEGEEKQTKGIGNLFNNIITENFPSPQKNTGSQVQFRRLTELPTIRTRKEAPQAYHNQNTQYKEQRQNIESTKREKTGYI
jgi:hypothetical protein